VTLCTPDPSHWREIPISLIELGFPGEQTAQAGENAWFRKLSQREGKLLASGTRNAVTAVTDKLHARS
jgi:hypothetical protein